MKLKLFLILVSSFLLFSCQDNKKKKSDENKIKIVQAWFANSNFVGETVATQKYDSINNIELEIIEGSYEIDPIKMVLSNEAQIGVSGADKVLVANDKGADLVVIGVINPISPVCFVSLTEKNIKTVQDFKGKNIGVLTGTATEYVYRSLLKKEGISSDEISETEISFDLNTFINKMYDVRPAFIFDEPISLRNKDIKINILKPENYGINFIGTVYFCKREYLNNNKEKIQNLINSLIQGWEFSINNNKKAIKYLKKEFPSIDENRELKSLEIGVDYFRGDDNKQLFAEIYKWKKMVESLIDLGIIKSFNENTIDYSFVKKYYDEN